MGVLEILSAAVEAVRSTQVAGLEVMEDVLHVHHTGGMKVDGLHGVQDLAGLGRIGTVGREFLQTGIAVVPYPFYLFREHGKVELDGVEAGKVAAREPLCHFRENRDELGAVHQVLVLDAVDCRCLRIDLDNPVVDIVPGLDLPGLDIGFTAGEDFDET